MMFRRPKASESGPAKNVPIPMPKTKDVMINVARVGSSGVSCVDISGIAGSIASIEKAIVANIIAIRAMNSARAMGRWRVVCVNEEALSYTARLQFGATWRQT